MLTVPGLVCTGALLSNSCSAQQAPEKEPTSEAKAPTTMPLPDGTKAMVELLASISKRVNGKGGLYGRPSLEVQGFLSQLEGAQKPAVIAGLQNSLGMAYLRSGEVDLALLEFDKIAQFLGRIKAPLYAQLGLADSFATGYLRKAENDNCLALHGRESCLMPLAGSGMHRDTTGARKAQDYLLQLLRLDPESRGARWLLNLSHMALDSYPKGVPEEYLIPPSLFQPSPPIQRFPNIATELGIDVLGMAGGVVLEDLDNDGFVDIMASAWGLEEQLVFLRNAGDGSFEDRTAAAGLTGLCGGLNLSHADYDNDGDADILVLRGAWKIFPKGHPNSLLRNNGDGTFSDVTVAAGLFSRHPTQVGQWADYDGDGWLDLFIGNETVGDAPHPSELYHNNRDGSFTNLAQAAGLEVLGFVKGASWGDYDGDGDPDLYVSRFGEPNQLFQNQSSPGKPKFVDVAQELGISEPVRSFSTWFFDFNNDGLLDLFVAPFPGFNLDSLDGVVRSYLGEPHELPTARLYAGQADGRFQDVSQAVGLTDAMLAMGANFGDLDNDGFLDLYIGTGEPELHTLVPNRMYRNDGAKRFENVTFSGGFGHLQKGHGIAFGDLDNDGDQDVYAVMGGAYVGDTAYNACFENPGSPFAWVTLHLQGKRSNRSALGATIRLTLKTAEGTRFIYRTVGTSGSFGSNTLAQEIGLGAAQELLSVEVRWPGQTGFEAYEGVNPRASYRLVESRRLASPLPYPRIQFSR